MLQLINLGGHSSDHKRVPIYTSVFVEKISWWGRGQTEGKGGEERQKGREGDKEKDGTEASFLTHRSAPEMPSNLEVGSEAAILNRVARSRKALECGAEWRTCLRQAAVAVPGKPTAKTRIKTEFRPWPRSWLECRLNTLRL